MKNTRQRVISFLMLFYMSSVFLYTVEEAFIVLINWQTFNHYDEFFLTMYLE